MCTTTPFCIPSHPYVPFTRALNWNISLSSEPATVIPFNWFTLRAPRWSKHSKEPHGLSKTWSIAVPLNRTIWGIFPREIQQLWKTPCYNRIFTYSNYINGTCSTAMFHYHRVIFGKSNTFSRIWIHRLFLSAAVRRQGGFIRIQVLSQDAVRMGSLQFLFRVP